SKTVSPVVKLGIIRTVLSLAVSRHWPIHQLDVKNAFLHGDLFETVYMHQPPGFWDSIHPDYVCWLQRHETDTAYLLLYVDDIIITTSSESLLQQIIRSLHQEFAMTDLGSLNYFLGISVTRDSSGLFLSQKKYAIEILDRAHMDNCNPSQTPIDTESKLGSDGDPVYDVTLYRSLATLKRILRYVRGTLDYGLQLFSSSTTDLLAYSDADWVGCLTTRRSTLGYCVFLGNNLLSWSSKRQPLLSRSNAEAEYHGVTNAVAETSWLCNLLRLGVTIGYHRLLTHKSFKIPKWLEYIIVYCGAQSGEGEPIYWVSVHKNHHKYVDTEKDPHTPPKEGWRIKKRGNVPELKAQWFYRFLHSTYIWHQVSLAILLYILGGFPHLAWAMIIPLSISHRNPKLPEYGSKSKTSGM
ncbi:ribonuclease H-like domain-containing protein, partial [Tanacetum coccineum]